jgi:L-threonylcarbamoyladenylate synthase
VTSRLPFSPDAIAEAAALIRTGAPVAIPTETVYGLAADATDPAAVARIYAAKGRPSFNPLIVHVLDLVAADGLADLGPLGRALGSRFWPGPLTIVAPLRPGAPIAALVTAGLPTIALRVPAHPAMQALLAASGRPLAAPSANASGTISPTRAEHVLRSLDGRIPLVIDAGATGLGLESTIVAVTGGTLRLLRPGPITADVLQAATGLAVLTDDNETIEAPGQLASHYAPSHPVRLDATESSHGEWLIGFGPIAGNRSLSPSGDLTEAAAALFDALHQADAAAIAGIAIAPIPETGLGLAINDRLRRAAAPRG